MAETSDGRTLVFMLDVDNTLLDNDGAKAAMAAAVNEILTPDAAAHFWQLYEVVRGETSVVNFPLTLARFAETYPHTAHLTALETLLSTFPYSRYVYPRTPMVLAYLWTLGTPVIVSDGDLVFQAYKIRESGLHEAVRGNVLIFDHKEQHLDEIRAQFPASVYVMVDDKERILDKMKLACGTGVVTVHVCQGKYAEEPSAPPTPDIELDTIGDLLGMTASDFRPREQ